MYNRGSGIIAKSYNPFLKNMKKNKVVIEFTRAEVDYLGLLCCHWCGYPKNNHFEYGKRLCAFSSDCKGYKETPKIGKFYEQETEKLLQ